MGRERRVIAALSFQMQKDLAFIFLEKAHNVVFGVALKANQAKAVFARGHVHAGLFAPDQDFHAGFFKLLRGNGVPAGMGDMEPGVHAPDDRMRPVDDAVLVHAPFFQAAVVGAGRTGIP